MTLIAGLLRGHYKNPLLIAITLVWVPYFSVLAEGLGDQPNLLKIGNDNNLGWVEQAESQCMFSLNGLSVESGNDKILFLSWNEFCIQAENFFI